MNTCFCGNPIGEDGILCTRCAALRVLELDSYATEKQIKASYRLLVKVWHPDRFQNDATLKWEAEAKLKKVNAAYSVLTSTFGNPGRSAKRARADAASQSAPATSNSASTTGWAPEPEPPRTFAMWLHWTSGILIKACILAFVILIGRYLWIAFDL
ncbi:MAG: J domain-containing protein, partial [Terracidiphilus sp.]